MFDKEAKRIDAVTVGTPDHIHAVASMAAIRAGKHVYCQKPLTHTLVECRTLTKAAQAAGLMTQMGNQGHASEGARLTNEWIQAGVIGEVREVHVWSDRAGRCGSKGSAARRTRRPCPGRSTGTSGSARSPSVPIIPTYAPAIGKAGGISVRGPGRHGLPHHRPPRLGPGARGAPSVVEARATLDGSVLRGNKPNFETYPIASIITFEFPARGSCRPSR